jgi:hypothetical protein
MSNFTNKKLKADNIEYNTEKVYMFLADSGYFSGVGKGKTKKDAYEWALKNKMVIVHEGYGGWEGVDYIEISKNKFDINDILNGYKEARENRFYRSNKRTRQELDNLNLDNVEKILNEIENNMDNLNIKVKADYLDDLEQNNKNADSNLNKFKNILTEANINVISVDKTSDDGDASINLGDGLSIQVGDSYFILHKTIMENNGEWKDVFIKETTNISGLIPYIKKNLNNKTDKKNDIKAIYKLEHPEDMADIVKIINELGYDVSLQEAEEIWGWFSGSVEAGWLSTNYYDENTKNGLKEIIEKYIEEKEIMGSKTKPKEINKYDKEELFDIIKYSHGARGLGKSGETIDFFDTELGRKCKALGITEKEARDLYNSRFDASKSQFAKTKDGWVVRVLNKNEDCIECGNWTVKYVDGKNIGKVVDINQNELTLIEGTDKEKSDHIVILLFGENKVLLGSNFAKVEEELKKMNIKYNIIEQGIGSIVAECLSNKTQNEIYDRLNDILHNDIGLEVMDYDKYNKDIEGSDDKAKFEVGNEIFFTRQREGFWSVKRGMIIEVIDTPLGICYKTKNGWIVDEKEARENYSQARRKADNENSIEGSDKNYKIPKQLEELAKYSKQFSDGEDFVNAVWKHLNVNSENGQPYKMREYPKVNNLPESKVDIQWFERDYNKQTGQSKGWFDSMREFWEVANNNKNITSSDIGKKALLSDGNIGEIVKIYKKYISGPNPGKDIPSYSYDMKLSNGTIKKYNESQVKEWTNIKSSDWEDEESKFNIGDIVKISEDEFYGGKIGEVADKDIERDMYNPGGNEWMNIYKIEGEGIDTDSAESWISEYNLEKVNNENYDKQINSVDENLKLRRKLDNLKEDRFHLEKKLNKSLGEKDKEQTKELLRRLEDMHDEIKKIEDKNKEKINSAEQEGYVIKNQNNDNEYFTVDMNGKGKWTKSAEQASIYDTIEEVNKVIGRLDELNDNNMKGYWEEYKMESKNIKSAEEGEGTMKNVSDIIPLIEKMEIDYSISLDGNAHEVNLQDVNEMTNDHYMYLDDKKFIDKWNGKGYSFHPRGEYDEASNNYDEFWFMVVYYIYTKDGGLITIDYHDWREDSNGVEEIRDSSTQANEIFEVIQSQNTWDIDIDTLVEKVNKKDNIKSKVSDTQKFLNKKSRFEKSGIGSFEGLEIKTVKDFFNVLHFHHKSTGMGYPVYFIMKDEQPLSIEDAIENAKLIAESIKEGYDDQWIPVATEVNWEDEDLYSSHSSKKIPSAYGEDQDEPIKKNKEGKVNSAEDFETIKNKVLDELTALTYQTQDEVGDEVEKNLFESVKHSTSKAELEETLQYYEQSYPELLGLTDNMNKIINSSKKGIKAEEGNPTGYETYNDGALIKYDEAKILEDFKNEHKRSYDVFEDIRRGEEASIGTLSDIMKKGVSAVDSWIDSMNIADYTYDVAIQTMEEFCKENNINEEHLSDNVKEEMRFHIEGLGNYNVEDLFNYPVLLKKVMAEIYTETGVVVGYDNIKWTPEANKWKKEALKYIDEQGIRDICNNATYGGMAFIGGIVSGSEIIKKMYDGEKIINVDTAIIGIHDSANGSGYYVEGNGNPVMDIKESKLDIGSYSLGAVFGTGEWVYASKKNNIKAEDNNFNQSAMVNGYLVTMLWSSNDESTPSGGEPMDKNYSIIDISDETKEEANKDCVEFAKQAGDLLKDKISTEDWWDVGHNFWLTRNGHGAGFWDSNNYDNEIGKKLTEICKKFGEKSPYVGDDGKIYANKKNIKDGPHKDGTLDISENVPEENEPQEDDMYLSDSGPLGSKTSVSVNQNFLGEYNSEEEAVKAIKEWINKNKFYPNIWYVSDHGNIIPYSIVTSSNIKGTGEADGDYDHEIFDKICSQIKSKTGINCEYKEFDKYQGVYIRAGRMKFWIKEVYYKGKKKNEDKNKPYSNSYLINPDGDKVSSTKGDYFNLKDNYVFEGYTLVLVDNKTGEKKNIENPTKSQLPNLLDVGYTFQYEDGSETMIMIFYEENNVEIEIEVSVKDPNGKKNVNTTGLVEYIKSNKIESAKSQFAKTKDGWVVRVLNKNEDCIECGNWQVKYVDGKNIGKVADINQNELTLIEDNGIKAEDVYEHTTMRIDNIIGKGKIYKDLSKEEIIEAEKKLRLRADRITKSEKMEVFVQILKERGFTKLSKELKERVVGKSIKAEEGEDYISSIKVTYEDGKEQIYKIGDIYGDLGELTVVKRITHNPAEYYIGFSAGAGGAEGYVKVGEDNIIEDFNKGKVKNIIELNGEENGIESSVVQSSMPNKFWIDNVILNISEGNPFREHEFKYEVLHKKYDAIDDIKQIKESLIKDLNKYNKIYPKLNTVKIWDALNMIKSENEGVTPVSQIVESAEAGKNQQTQIKCKVKIILGDNFDTPELVAKEYDNTIIGGDKLDIETLASSFSEGIVEFWPIVKSNVNFSDYKDEQEVIDWFENEIVTVIMDSMESLFGNRPELVEVKDIQFIKKHGIPVSQIVESSEEVPQNVYLDYDKDDTYYGSIMKYDENKDMIYFKNFYNTNETWNMPREEFEEMLESGELKESKVPKK